MEPRYDRDGISDEDVLLDFIAVHWAVLIEMPGDHNPWQSEEHQRLFLK